MNEKEVQRRIDSPENILNILKKGNDSSNRTNGGRKEGEKNLTPFLRGVIGAAASMDTAKNAADAFGVSRVHAQNLSQGIIDRPSGVREEVISKVEENVNASREKAATLILKTLNLITDEKLGEIEKVRDLTAVAKDLSHVVEKTSPKKEGGNGTGVNILIYSPKLKHSDEFGEVIEVESREIR